MRGNTAHVACPHGEVKINVAPHSPRRINALNSYVVSRHLRSRKLNLQLSSGTRHHGRKSSKIGKCTAVLGDLPISGGNGRIDLKQASVSLTDQLGVKSISRSLCGECHFLTSPIWKHQVGL